MPRRLAASTSVAQSWSRACVHRRLDLRALKDDAGRRLAPGEADGEIEQGLVFDDPARLDAAARGEHHLRLGVVDPRRQLLGGEAAEHHRMDGADARAGEHADDRLRNHRHIDQDPVARRDAEVLEHGAERRRLVEELTIGDRALGRGDRAVVIERRLIAAAGLHMPVERIEAGVARARRGTSGRRRRASGSKMRSGGLIQAISRAASAQKACGSARQ